MLIQGSRKVGSILMALLVMAANAVAQDTTSNTNEMQGPEQGTTLALSSSATDPQVVVRLRELLAPHGWNVTRGEEGDIYLLPGRGPVVERDPSEPPAFSPADIESVRRLLAPHGWQVEPDDAGGVLLIPGGIGQTTLQDYRTGYAVERKPAVAPRREFGSEDINRLRTLLSPHGWRIESDDQGGVLMFPPGAQPAAPDFGAQTTDDQSGGQVPRFTGTDVLALRRLLSPYGWWVESDGYGGIMLVPAVRTETDRGRLAMEQMQSSMRRPSSASARWQGLLPEPVSTGAVGLPLAGSQDVRQIASHWVRRNGEPGTVPGRIRKIGRVYLVSVVTGSPPHYLRRQLVVREDDGHLFVVF